MKADDPQTYAVIGAAMAVHRELGCGFLEAVYQEALAVELEMLGVPFVRESQIPIRYRGRILRTNYRADFIAFGEIVVELKAQSALTGIDQAQVLNYLKATAHRRALLFNFGTPRLEYHRLVL